MSRFCMVVRFMITISLTCLCIISLIYTKRSRLAKDLGIFRGIADKQMDRPESMDRHLRMEVKPHNRGFPLKLKYWFSDASCFLNGKSMKVDLAYLNTGLQSSVFGSQKYFVNLKSNSALLYNKSHNLLTSAFPQKNVKLIKFQLKSWILPY